MLKYLMLFLFAINALMANEFVNLPKDKNLKAFKNLYGEPINQSGNIYQFEKENQKITAYIENDKIIKAEFKLYKSNKTIENSKELLQTYQLLKKNDHSKGRSFAFYKKNELIIFNNNSKKNLKKVIIQWEK